MVRLSTNTNSHYFVTTHPARLAAPVPRFIEPVRQMVVLSEFLALVCFGTTRKVGGETSFTKITPDETAFKLAFRHSPATRFSRKHLVNMAAKLVCQEITDYGAHIALSPWGCDHRTSSLAPGNLEHCCRSLSCRQRSDSPGGIDCRHRE